MKRDHFTRLINLQNGSLNPEKKKNYYFLIFFFFLPLLDLGPFQGFIQDFLLGGGGGGKIGAG